MNAKPLTLAQIREILSAEAPQIVIRKADGEFRITFTQAAIAETFPGLSRAELIEKAESLAAYESDAESALAAGRAMARVGLAPRKALDSVYDAYGTTRAELAAEAAPAQAETARRDDVEYHNGRRAFEAGEPLSANPYLARDGDSRFARWLAGWRDAERALDPARATVRDNRQAQREGIAAIAEREQAPAVAAVRETIRFEMNWSGAAGIIAAALENGTGAGRKAAREELARMADCADTWSRFASPVIDLAAAARALLADNNPGSRAALHVALDAIDAAADA